MSDSGEIFDSSPPWMLGKPQSCMEEVTLHDEIQLFCKWISPTREEQMMRESVIVRISCVVCQLWPTAQVKTYGSYATQLYLPNSDVDLCVTGAPPGPQSLVTLAEVLHAKELSTQLHVISSAKVPIIKLTDKVSGSIVDISLNQDVRTNELVSSYMERYPALRPLTLILKLFLFQRRLHESYTGGLSSFSLLIIIVSFLQFHVPDNTNKNGPKIASKSNLGNLLTDFFKFYGKQFDYEHIGISIRDSGAFFPKISRNWYDPFNPCVFSLESPLDQTSDVGRGGFATPRVIAAFAKAYEELTSGVPRLSSVLIVDSTIIERRSHIMSLYTRQSSSPPVTLHRTQRSVSATAAMQTVPLHSQPFKTSISIPIPSSYSSSSSIAISTPNSSAPNTTITTNENTNTLFLSSSAPPQPLSPPSPPSSHTPIHISPATSPRLASIAAVPILAHTTTPIHTPTPTSAHKHPTIAGFDAKPATDSSTDTDTDTDAEAEVETAELGEYPKSSSTSTLRESPTPPTNPVAAPSAKSAFYNCHPSMSGFDHYLHTLQNIHLQALHPPPSGKSSKNAKRFQQLQQLQQQLVQHHMGMVNGDTQPHTTNVNTCNKPTKATKKDKHRSTTSTPTHSTPPSKPCIINDPPTPPAAIPTTKGRRNSNPHSRRNSNPQQVRRNSNPQQVRRNSNPHSRRNSNPPAPSPSTIACSPVPSCPSIPESHSSLTASHVASPLPPLPPHMPLPVSLSTPPTPTNAILTSSPIHDPLKPSTNCNSNNNNSNNGNNNNKPFSRPNHKQQQRWAPKVSTNKKLNLLQSSLSVPVSN